MKTNSFVKSRAYCYIGNERNMSNLTKQQTFRDATMTFEKRVQKFHTDDV